MIGMTHKPIISTTKVFKISSTLSMIKSNKNPPTYHNLYFPVLRYTNHNLHNSQTVTHNGGPKASFAFRSST